MPGIGSWRGVGPQVVCSGVSSVEKADATQVPMLFNAKSFTDE